MSKPLNCNSLNILVTGGAGFIGSALVRHLIQNTQHQVINVDKLTYAANLKSVEEVSNNPRYYFEQVDICDSQQIKRIFNQHQPDLVFNLAAESHVDRSIAQPTDFIQTNIVGTFNLLDQSRAYLAENPQKQNTFRFIHVSTDEVYGDLSDTTVIPSQSEGSPDSGLRADFVASSFPQNDSFVLSAFTETSPCKPSSPYSASKAASDHLIQAWWRTYHLPGIKENLGTELIGHISRDSSAIIGREKPAKKIKVPKGCKETRSACKRGSQATGRTEAT